MRDTYFCARYMQENLSLDAEALLVRSLTEMAAEQEAALLVNSHVSGAGVQGMAEDGAVADVWELGLPPAMVLAPTLIKTGKGPRAILKQLPVLTSVGAAAAALPSILRKAQAELADCHQVWHRGFIYLALPLALLKGGGTVHSQTVPCLVV